MVREMREQQMYRDLDKEVVIKFNIKEVMIQIPYKILCFKLEIQILFTDRNIMTTEQTIAPSSSEDTIVGFD